MALYMKHFESSAHSTSGQKAAAHDGLDWILLGDWLIACSEQPNSRLIEISKKLMDSLR